MDCIPPGSSVHRFYPSKNNGVGCHALLQGIFLTKGLNTHLLCLLKKLVWIVKDITLILFWKKWIPKKKKEITGFGQCYWEWCISCRRSQEKYSSEEKSIGSENSLAIKKEALFVILLMFLHQNWFMKFVILTIDQEFIACSVGRTGNFRVSSMTRLLFGQIRAFSF